VRRYHRSDSLECLPRSQNRQALEIGANRQRVQQVGYTVDVIDMVVGQNDAAQIFGAQPRTGHLVNNAAGTIDKGRAIF
jgi:hypothetical protein